MCSSFTLCFVENFSINITASTASTAPCGLQGCKNGPAPFPGRISYKATKQGLALSVVYLSMFYVLLFIRAPFYVLLVFVATILVGGKQTPPNNGQD